MASWSADLIVSRFIRPASEIWTAADAETPGCWRLDVCSPNGHWGFAGLRGIEMSRAVDAGEFEHRFFAAASEA